MFLRSYTKHFRPLKTHYICHDITPLSDMKEVPHPTLSGFLNEYICLNFTKDNFFLQ